MQDRYRQIDENPLATHGRTIHWVNRVDLTACRLLPVYPDKRTSSAAVGMSQNGMDRPCSRPEPLRE